MVDDISLRADSSGSDPTTIFVKGFDKYQGEDDVRQALTEVFQECGEIASVRLPTDRETQELKGIAFIQFAAPEGKVCLWCCCRSCSCCLLSLFEQNKLSWCVRR